MMRQRGKTDRQIAAVVAAIYAVILHAILGIGGASASPAFSVICAASGGSGIELGDHAADGPHQMACCLSACASDLGPAADAVPVVHREVEPGAPRLAVPAVETGARGERTPGDPRGPPAAA